MKESIIKFVKRFDYPNEAVQSLLADFEKIESCPERLTSLGVTE